MPSKDFPQTRSGMVDALTFVELETRRLRNIQEDVVDRVVLVVGEVLANAIEHGGSDPRRLMGVEVGGSGAAVELEIREASDAVQPAWFDEACLPHDVLATGGRGLFLVRSLADGIEAGGARGLRFTFSPRRPL